MPSTGEVLSGFTSASQPTHCVSCSGSVIHGQISSGARSISTLARMRPASLRFEAIQSPAAPIKSTATMAPPMRRTYFIPEQPPCETEPTSARDSSGGPPCPLPRRLRLQRPVALSTRGHERGGGIGGAGDGAPQHQQARAVAHRALHRGDALL